MFEDASNHLPFVVTMGEPAGVGGELTLMAWRTAKQRSLPVFAAIDDAMRLEGLARALNLDVPIRKIAALSEAAAVFATALPVLDMPLPRAVAPGRPDASAAFFVIKAIDIALEAALSGKAGGIVTNPIHKESLYAAGFSAPGHTEYLAEQIAARTKTPLARPVMMLAARDLRVVPVTIHLSLKDAIASLTPHAIVETARVTRTALIRDFGITAPRIAVAALNPHAGEGGALGREEIDIIAPAVATLRADGFAVEGPLPADTLFHEDARARYDAVLCMYHDQALIPLKTVDFWGGVNITLGLDVVRTSPDHGTAFDLAGTGRVNPESLIAAIECAMRIAQNRRRHGAR